MKSRPDLYILVDGRKIYVPIEAIMSHIRKKETNGSFRATLFPIHLSNRTQYILPPLKSTLPSRDLHTPKPLPQLPRPRRTPPPTPLPIRIALPITKRSSLCRRRYHLDAVLANGVISLGRIAGVGFVFFEGFFEGVGGLAFSFEVFGEVFLNGRTC